MIATIRNAINMATTDISIISNNLANSKFDRIQEEVKAIFCIPTPNRRRGRV